MKKPFCEMAHDHEKFVNDFCTVIVDVMDKDSAWHRLEQINAQERSTLKKREKSHMITISQKLDVGLDLGIITPRAYRLFRNFKLFEDFMSMDSKRFFEIFDYYDVFFIEGMGKSSFSKLQTIFPEFRKPFSISSEVKLAAFEKLEN